MFGHGHSERLLGQLVASVPRDDLVLSSKVGYFAGTAAHPYLPSHMRRQLETTLENLCTDRLDIYFFHNANFGPADRHLDAAMEQMRTFQREGLINAVGMRGPHRFATERLTVPKQHREDKHARFLHLFQRVRPDYLAVRYNALTPPPPAGQPDIFSFAAEHGTSVLINKPLAQGLLTGKHTPTSPPRFEDGDHRRRKQWFTPTALELIHDGLRPLRERFGSSTSDQARVAVEYCHQHADNAAVLVGFTTPEQVTQNITAAATPLTPEELDFVRTTMQQLQHRLDEAGAVFVDEKTTPQP